MHAKLLVVSVFVIAFLGCITSSGPVPFGKDSYMISIDARGGQGHVLSDAIKEANAHCASLGKEFVPRNTSQSGVPGWTTVNAQLIYSCVDKNDPEYTRPNMEKVPNTVIKVK